MAVEPVSLFEARDHLKLDATNGTHPDDALVQAYIEAAREHVENRTGRTLVTTSRTEYFDAWQDEFVLMWAPVISVTTLKYVDLDGTLTTLASTVYRVDTASLRARVTLEYDQTWPDARAVQNAIQFVYSTGATVPAALKQAVLLTAAHWYENRAPVGPGSLADMPHMVDALVNPHRIITL